MEIVLLAIIILAVFYKLGLFRPVIDLTDVATRESSVYNRSHKSKVAKRYLGDEYTFSEDEKTKINNNIKAIDELNFD